MAIILANDGIDQSAKVGLEALGHVVDTNKYEGDALLARLKEVDCVIVRSATKLRTAQIDAAVGGKLKLMIRAGVGLDNIDVDYAVSKGFDVTNTPAASSNAVAELTLAHMIGMTRHLHSANRSMAKGQWLKKEYDGTEIMGKTLGIIGLGRIGVCLAEKAKALGMKVIYYKNHKVDGWEYAELDELLKTSDIISLHMPFLGNVVLGANEFAKMKDGVYVMNCSRGGLIDEDALVDAIESGKVRAAALDCFKEEPTKNERLLNCDRISLSPHIGAATEEAQGRIGDNIVAIIKEKF